MSKVTTDVTRESITRSVPTATQDTNNSRRSGSTKIEWTDRVWNPFNGCTKISAGCKNCYAAKMARRLQGMQKRGYRNGFEISVVPERLDNPSHWKKPSMIFVNSMGDLFHKDVPQEYRQRIFQVMNECTRHTFQILTKRPEELVKVQDQFNWTSNIWIGVTVESAQYLSRVDQLRQVPAHVRFLSCEPLLGPLGQFDLSGIHWVIAGGESGPGARPVQEAWVTELKDWSKQCHTPFFFKQWGGVHRRLNGRLLEGREWNEMPTQ